MIARWSEASPTRTWPRISSSSCRARRRHPWWRARHRLTLALLARLGVRPPARVLDAGCGWGVTLEALERQGYRAVGMDVSRRAPSGSTGRAGALIEADLTRPLPGGSTLRRRAGARRHRAPRRRPRRRRALGRLARPGGVVVVSVPALPDLFTEFDGIQGTAAATCPTRCEPRSRRGWSSSSLLVGLVAGAVPATAAGPPPGEAWRVGVGGLCSLPEAPSLAGPPGPAAWLRGRARPGPQRPASDRDLAVRHRLPAGKPGLAQDRRPFSRRE